MQDDYLINSVAQRRSGVLVGGDGDGMTVYSLKLSLCSIVWQVSS